MKILNEISRTLGEYLLIPNLSTEDCVPANVSLAAPVIRHPVGETSKLTIATPLTGAIMQAISSARMSIAIAQCGGLGFIHQNQSVDDQAAMVRSVKRHKAGFRHSEVTVAPAEQVGAVAEQLAASGIGVAAVTDSGQADGKFLGLMFDRDLRLASDLSSDTVADRMRPVAELICAEPSITLSEANSRLLANRLDVLPIVDDDGILRSLVLRRDYELHTTFKNESVDAEKRFRVGAGVNTRDYAERIPALVEAGADLMCIDSSDGFSVWQERTLRYALDEFGPDVAIGAGNVVDSRGFRFLAEAGAAFVKVGIGGGSICITRDQKGIGRGQASALIDVVAERDRYAAETGVYVPICCDGGLLSDYHMAIALALGADFIMLGRYFARFDESPSRMFSKNGQFFKEYWGEGSRRARNLTRYDQGADHLVFEEGVDGYVPYAGSLYDTVALTIAKLKATMVSCGSISLREFHDSAVLVLISEQSHIQNTHEVALREGNSDLGS